MAFQTVKFVGLSELQRALLRVDAQVRGRLREQLAALGEPVRQRAEDLAGTEVRNITPDWQELRLGVTNRLVYIVPRQRGTKHDLHRRPAFGDLMMSRALNPAGEELRPALISGLNDLLDEIAHAEGFTTT